MEVLWYSTLNAVIQCTELFLHSLQALVLTVATVIQKVWNSFCRTER